MSTLMTTTGSNVAGPSFTAQGYQDLSQVATIDDPAVQFMMTDMDLDGERRGMSRNFPAQLHYVLNELEADGMADICGYQPHGRCFVVRKQKEFVEQILCRWFRQSQYASFQRQLNIYGFQRIASGPDKNAYYHPFFLRSKPFLAECIPRQRLKGKGPRRASSLLSQPNFYAMTFLPATPAATVQICSVAQDQGTEAPRSMAVVTPTRSSDDQTERSLVNHSIPSYGDALAALVQDQCMRRHESHVLGPSGGCPVAVPMAQGSLSGATMLNYLVQRDLARSLTLRHQAAQETALLQHQYDQQNRNRCTLAALVALRGTVNF